MNSFVVIFLLSVSAMLMIQAAPAPQKSYGKSYAAVPPLPPFGVAAKHPRYGKGGAYGSYGSSYGNNDYITALRYEATNRDSYGVQTSYAYDVDGQKVQVARIDPIKYY